LILHGKIKKYLSNTRWFHATTLDDWHEINKNGVIADYNKETSAGLDFGYGFYMTNDNFKAEKFIYGLKKVDSLAKDDVMTIAEFTFSPLNWFEANKYNTYIINSHNDEFANFVYENRMYNINGSKQHKYDVIFGVMTDTRPNKIIDEHKAGIIPKSVVLDEFKKSISMKQLSLHNQKLCDMIKPVKAYVFEIDSENKTLRKELDQNGRT